MRDSHKSLFKSIKTLEDVAHALLEHTQREVNRKLKRQRVIKILDSWSSSVVCKVKVNTTCLDFASKII